MRMKRFLISLVSGAVLLVPLGVATASPASAAPVASTAVSTEQQDLDVQAKGEITVKCQLVRHGGEAVGYIYGKGSGKTRSAAVKAAKKNADTKVPLGYYKRHCKVPAGGGGSGSW